MDRKLSIIMLIVLLFTSGLAFAGGVAEEPEAAVAVASEREAPALASLVAQGELPPVEQRLPSEPLVVEPFDRVGEYGGTWRRPMVGGADTANLIRTVLYNGLVRWNPEWSAVIPNIAKSFSVSSDSRTYTFVLREGMRWSDGQPFSVDDVKFWYEAVFSNPLLNPEGRVYDGVPVEKFEIVDENTFALHFAEPSGLFLQRLAGPGTGDIADFARHYFEQYHIDYNPDADAKAAAEGFDDWAALFLHKADFALNVDRPSLNAWVVTIPLDGTATEVRYERNPYFWKVDTEGNQLPYIDSVVFEDLNDTEVALLRTMEGRYDLIARHVATVQNRPVLYSGMERGDYRIFDLVSDASATGSIQFNYNHPDPAMREMIHNKNFRIGLSHAIDREEINQIIYGGTTEPWQVAPRRESAYYDEEFAKQYTEFDLDLANSYLDRAGYTQRNEDGLRLRADGDPLTFTIEVWTDTDEVELIREHLRRVGIDMSIRTMDRSLWLERKNNALNDAVWFGTGGSIQPILSPQRYLPNFAGAHHAVRWAAWYIDPNDSFAEVPPEPVQRKLRLYDQIRRTGDQQRQFEHMSEIISIARESFRLIGTVLAPPEYMVVRNDFHNVPRGLPQAWPYPTPGPWNPEQFFTTRDR